jgi:hypothetical protein
VRLLDTRVGLGAPLGASTGGTELRLHVGGGDVPSTGADAVVLNVTATEPMGAGFVAAYPCGGGIPTVSNLNFTAGQTVPNQVVVKVGEGGDVCLFSNVTTHLIADVGGWYAAPGGAPGARFHPVTPDRFIDTRETTKVEGGSPLALTVVGGHGVPGPETSPVTAVTMNVTVTEPEASGFVTVYPCGQDVPTVSNLNFVAGQTIANLVTVKVGAGGQVCLFSNVSTHLIADASGWYGAEGATDGSSYTAISPSRLLDTRIGNGTDVPPAASGVRNLTVLDRNGVPATGVDAVVLNVTAVEPSGAGFVTVYPSGQPIPTASNLNFTAGAVVPNLVTVRVGADGQICLYTSTNAHLVVDIAGYFRTGD